MPRSALRRGFVVALVASIACNAGSQAIGDAGETDAGSADATLPDAAAPRFVPADLSDLVLWLRADFADSVDGKVAYWRDGSGQGNHAIQTSPAAQPKLIAATNNAPAGLEFSGAQSLAIPNALGIGAGEPRTFLVVAKLHDERSRAPLLLQGDFDNIGENWYLLETNTFNSIAGRYGLYIAGSAFETEQPTQTKSPAVLALRTRTLGVDTPRASSFDFRYNGNSRAHKLVAASDAAQTQPTPIVTLIGGWVAGNGLSYASAVIHEIIVYGRGLNDDELSRVESYAKTRYGIQ